MKNGFMIIFLLFFLARTHFSMQGISHKKFAMSTINQDSDFGIKERLFTYIDHVIVFPISPNHYITKLIKIYYLKDIKFRGDFWYISLN